jgi:hypothetical protein
VYGWCSACGDGVFMGVMHVSSNKLAVNRLIFANQIGLLIYINNITINTINAPS